MKKGLLVCLLFVAFALSAQEPVMFRNDRTGIYQETGLLQSWPENGPDLLWHFDGMNDGYTSPVISKDKIYITGMTDGKGIIYVLDLNGKLLQQKEYGTEWTTSYGGTRSAVMIDSGKLYLISGVGDVFCMNEETLELLWKKNFEADFGGAPPRHGVHESPLIVGEKLFVTPGGKEHNVVALNKNTGELIWSCAAEGDVSSYCCPIYLDDQQVPQVVTMTGHHVIGIDIAKGEMLWSVPFTNRFYEHPNTPVYGDNMLLCTSSYGVGSIMIRLSDGGRKAEEVWKSADLDSRTGHMVKIGGYAYGAGDYKKGSWYCVDWVTGEQLYKDKTIATGAVIAADGMLYCYSEKGELALVKVTPDKFDMVSCFTVTLGTGSHWAHPVIYKGVLYVRHGDTLMAYKIN